MKFDFFRTGVPSSEAQSTKKNRNECNPLRLFSLFHAPTQLVAPRAVTIAVAILAIICTMNLIVSLFVMVLNV